MRSRRSAGVLERGERLPVVEERADGRSSAAGDHDHAAIQVETGHRHLVLGHRARLVGADDRGGAERLDRRETTDERPGAGQPPEPGGEGHRGHRREPLGDRGDREADRGLEHEPHGKALQDARGADDGADRGGETHQPAPETLDLALERRRPLARFAHELADAPQLGGAAGRRDDPEAAAGDHRGAEVGHGPPLGERGLGRQPGRLVLLDRLALARQRRLGHAEGGRPDQPAIRGNLGSRLEHDHVAGHQVGRRQAGDPAVAPRQGVGDRERPQPGQRPTGVPLGAEADAGVEHEGDEDRHRFHALAEERGDGGGGQEEQHHQAAELPERQSPQRGVRPVGDAVGPGRGEAMARLAGRQTLVGIGAEEREDLRARQRVPRHGGRRRRLARGNDDPRGVRPRGSRGPGHDVVSRHAATARRTASPRRTG